MIKLKVGTRGSQLALCQTKFIVEKLNLIHPDISCNIEVIKTKGDKIADVPLSKIGDKGIFVSEIEQSLIRGDIDFAVHSSKDLPSNMDERLTISAYPKRDTPADALLSHYKSLSELPKGSVIGTSSLRRRAQLLNKRPDINVVELRGNIDTRIMKLDAGQYDAIVIAAAGLIRLELDNRIAEILSYDVCLPAAGQGALAVQCRKGDKIEQLIKCLDDAETRICVEAEKSFLKAVNAGCQTPIAALANISDNNIELFACVASLDGKRIIRMSEKGNLSEGDEVVNRLANRLLNSPAKEIFEEIKDFGSHNS